MPVPKITKTLISNLEPVSKRTFIWEENTPGFGIAVQPSGAISFVFQYRNENARSRRMTLGNPSNLTPDQARGLARDYMADVRKGADPQASKVAARKALQISELFEEYLRSATFGEKARSTQDTDRGRIKNHLLPLLGSKIASKITREDVKAARRAIEEGKTARDEKTGWRARSVVRGGAGAARQSIRLLKAVFQWAIGEKLFGITENPVDGISLNGDGKRDVIMGGAKDYRSLFETLERMEAERRVKSSVADVIRIIALTGARRGEIIGLKWSEVDFDKRQINKPPTRHKAGKKTGEPRIIGMSSEVISILLRQPNGAPESLVFPPTRLDAAGREYAPSRKGAEGRLDVSVPWRKIREEANLPAGIGLHGLRHSLASHMAMRGAQEAKLKEQLGHKQSRTVQRYIHWANDARTLLAEEASAVVLGGNEIAKND